MTRNRPDLAVEHPRRLGPDPVVFLVETSAPLFVDGARPVRPDDDERDVAFFERPVDHVGEDLAVGDIVDVLKNDVAETAAQRIAQASGPAVAIGAAVADEDTGHAGAQGCLAEGISNSAPTRAGQASSGCIV